MKKCFFIGLVVLLTALAVSIFVLSGELSQTKRERDTYKGNTAALLGDVKRYKTSDSLNAASVGVLQLTIGELEKYRSEDLNTIKQLEVKNRRIESVGRAELESSYTLIGKLRDSIGCIVQAHKDKPPDTIPEKLKCIDIVGDWFEMHGCSNESGEFKGEFESRDSLQHVQTVKYKRFLGFLWETKKVKDRQFDIVSKNPNTKIVDVEYITIRKD